MNILLFAEGCSIHTQRIANRLATLGHQVSIISGSPFLAGYNPSINQYMIPQYLKFLPSLHISALSDSRKAHATMSIIRHLVELIKPDIANAIYIGVPALLALASGFHPLILTAQGSDLMVYPNGNFFRKQLIRRILSQADRLICMSPIMAARATELGYPSHKTLVTPIGIDTAEFAPLGVIFSLTFPNIVCTRAFAPIYNHEVLLKAMPAILRKYPEATLTLAGNGPLLSEMRTLTYKLGIRSSTHFIGTIPHEGIHRLVSRADIYISPALSDGASISLLEALACETPSVAADIPANAPWLPSAFRFEPHSPAFLAETIIRTLENPDYTRMCMKICRTLVQQKAEFNTEIDKVIALYKELIR